MRWWLLATIASLAALAGCASGPVIAENPILIPSNDYEAVFNSTVAVVDRYFEIERQDRHEGVIETFPEPSATVFEPWRRDPASLRDRWENTFQTYRRRAFVTLTPQPGAGILVTATVYREIEDLQQPLNATAGSAVFRNEMPNERVVVTEVVAPGGWLPAGRDFGLELKILRDLQRQVW